MLLAGIDILSILLCIISLGILVIIHELGHFTMAKLFNVYVNEFSIGFGPQLLKKKKGETTYSLRAIPLGGYVSMFGEGMEDGPDGEEVKNIPQERSLLGIKKWKRAIIMAAGIVLNFVLGFLLFFTNNAFFGQPTLSNQVTVAEKSVIEEKGLKTGDYIIEVSRTCFIDGDANAGSSIKTVEISSENPTDLWYSALAIKVEGENGYDISPKTQDDTLTLALKYYSEGEQPSDARTIDVTLTVEVAKDGTLSWSKMGISTFYQYVRYKSLGAILGATNRDFGDNTVLIAKTLGGLFVGKNWDAVGGPVAIFTQSSQVLKSYGFGMFIYLWGAISVNLAIFNLLPFPGLDGWHLLVVIIEGITKKEIPEKVKNIVSTIGLILLFGLMIFIMGRDIIRLF